MFELYGGIDGKNAGKQKINLHFGHNEDGTRTSSRGWGVWIEKKPKKLSKPKFHEFVVEWSTDKVECFTDGVKIYRYTNKKLLKYFNEDTAQQWIVVNHSLQEQFSKDKENYEGLEQNFKYSDDYYSEFFVDYVRAYKKK